MTSLTIFLPEPMQSWLQTGVLVLAVIARDKADIWGQRPLQRGSREEEANGEKRMILNLYIF